MALSEVGKPNKMTKSKQKFTLRFIRLVLHNACSVARGETMENPKQQTTTTTTTQKKHKNIGHTSPNHPAMFCGFDGFSDKKCFLFFDQFCLGEVLFSHNTDSYIFIYTGENPRYSCPKGGSRRNFIQKRPIWKHVKKNTII